MLIIRRCPDGRPWCTGVPEHHTGTGRIHVGPEYALTGSYAREPLLGVGLFQLDDEPPTLAFSDGSWPDLSGRPLDELVDDLAVHVVRLRSLRDHLHRLTEAHRAGVAGMLSAAPGGDELRVRALLT
ncbi:hypothetical protein ACFVG1_36715, partial [Streptomyces bacillaris]